MDEKLVRAMLEAEGVDLSAADAVIKITRFLFVGAIRAFQGDLKSMMEDLELVAKEIEKLGLPNCPDGNADVGNTGTGADGCAAGSTPDNSITA